MIADEVKVKVARAERCENVGLGAGNEEEEAA